MLTQFTKQSAFDSGFERRLHHLVYKEAAYREMEKESMNWLARTAGRGLGAATRGGGSFGGFLSRELPMLPTTLLGHARRLGGRFGEEFSAARGGMPRPFQGMRAGEFVPPPRPGAGGMPGGSMGDVASNPKVVSNKWTPPPIFGGPTTGTTSAPGPGGSSRFQFSGPHGSPALDPSILNPAIAAAGGEGAIPPAGGKWFQNLMGRAPGVQNFVNKHQLGTGLGVGAAGMYGVNQYGDYRRREAIRNMGGLDRLQAALGLVFSPNEFANRLY